MRGWLAKLLGDAGERKATRYLRRKGYRIIARQYSNHIGEIDLIALDGETIVFVEVKTRRSDSAGRPEEAVTQSKQAKLTRTALVYLKKNGLLEQRARFDVVAIIWAPESRSPEIRHIRNAFTPTESGQMFA